MPIDGFVKTFTDFEKASKGEKTFTEAFMGWRSDAENAAYNSSEGSSSSGSERSERSTRPNRPN